MTQSGATATVLTLFTPVLSATLHTSELTLSTPSHRSLRTRKSSASSPSRILIFPANPALTSPAFTPPSRIATPFLMIIRKAGPLRMAASLTIRTAKSSPAYRRSTATTTTSARMVSITDRLSSPVSSMIPRQVFTVTPSSVKSLPAGSRSQASGITSVLLPRQQQQVSISILRISPITLMKLVR